MSYEYNINTAALGFKQNFRDKHLNLKIMNERDQVIIYQTEDGQTQVDVRMENDTVWLTANQMAMLFERDEKTIRKHINNVFSEGELEKENNTHFLRVDGVKQSVAFYTLDVIISVGYRVKSQRGVKFRQWANRKQESHRDIITNSVGLFILCGGIKIRSISSANDPKC